MKKKLIVFLLAAIVFGSATVYADYVNPELTLKKPSIYTEDKFQATAQNTYIMGIELQTIHEQINETNNKLDRIIELLEKQQGIKTASELKAEHAATLKSLAKQQTEIEKKVKEQKELTEKNFIQQFKEKNLKK